MKPLSGKICFLWLIVLIALSGCRGESNADQKKDIALTKIDNPQLLYFTLS